MKKISLLALLIFSLPIYADQVAKEELTPPPPYGALTPDQIPPLTSTGKPLVSPSPSPSPSSPAQPNTVMPSNPPAGTPVSPTDTNEPNQDKMLPPPLSSKPASMTTPNSSQSGQTHL